MVKISEFIIGMVMVSLTIGVFMNFMAEGQAEYNLTDYDQSQLAAYEKLDDLYEKSGEIKDRTNISDKSGITDLIGGYFSDAYSAIKLTTTSFDIFEGMADSAINQTTHLTDSSTGRSSLEMFKIAGITIVLVLIFIGIALSVILKKDV